MNEFWVFRLFKGSFKGKCVVDMWIVSSLIFIRYLNSFSLLVPCRPTNVKAALLCETNSAAVTWERASGALSYLAVAVTEDGSHRAECNNTVTNCDLHDLHCGQTYNVSVFGQDKSCSSAESQKAYVRTGIVNLGGEPNINMCCNFL